MTLSKQLRTDITGYAFILPNILGVVLFFLVPIVFSLVISFTDWDFTWGIGNWNWVGLENYLEIWKDGWFVRSLINTVILSFGSVFFIIIFAIVFATIIDAQCYGSIPIRLAMFMPKISNIVAISIIWVMMYSPWGPVTQLLQGMGIENPPKFLGSYTWALPAIIFMMIWSGIGYAVMIYSAALQGLPKEVYEAAEIDGAGPIKCFFTLTIHFLSPTTFFLIVTTLISMFQIFAPIQLMTQGGPGSSTSVLVYYIYTSAFSFYKMGYASAMSWVLFLLLFSVTLFQWNYQKRWVNY